MVREMDWSEVIGPVSYARRVRSNLNSPWVGEVSTSMTSGASAIGT